MGTFNINNYKIFIEKIGEGSFSSVYKGININTNEEVAVKKINKKGLDSMRSYIDREIELMKGLNHKNILKLYDVIYNNCNEEENIYLILEYCPCGDLSHFLNKKGINEIKSKMFLKQIAEGLKYLIDNNISHRDLKPQNILLSDENTLKITDFGFAKTINSEELSTTICGSPLYMAPEILNYKKYTDKADLWSVGVILYELLTGDTPYSANNIYDLVRMMKYEEVIIPNYINLTSECKHILFSLLQKDPKKRLSWDDFYYHPWFNTHDEINNLYNNIFDDSKLEKKYIDKISLNDKIIMNQNNNHLLIEGNKKMSGIKSLIDDNESNNSMIEDNELMFEFEDDNLCKNNEKNDYILIDDKINNCINNTPINNSLTNFISNLSNSIGSLSNSIYKYTTKK
jgi:serine/threonine-protein kinase ULK/ATG1